MRHTGQVPRVYLADHAAHIRDRIKRQALYYITGAIIAVLSAVTFAIVLSQLRDAPHTLTAMGWGLVIVLALIAGLGLSITGVEFLLYRHRRADLDAAGAEVMGELYARLHRPTDGG